MNKLQDIFCSDNSVAEREIKRMINQAYDMQWCITCKNSYFDTPDFDGCIECSIS